MNWDQIRGNWTHLSGPVKEKWDRLTDDDLIEIAGKREQFAGLLQKRYGYAKEDADKEIDDFAWKMKL